jgi:ATP/maltotriose-dependent transcriptional regulator MalT
MVSSLRLAATWLIVLGDHAGAAAALDEADALIQPDWGAEFRMTLLRSRTRLASEMGQTHRALQTACEEIALARRSRDWRLEVIARTNQAEVLWQAGDFAQASALLEALRVEIGTRPVTNYELLDLLQLQSAVASEHGSAEHALQSARAALPAMRSTRRFNLPLLAHLLLRLDRCDAAARLVGAFDARNRAGLEIVGASEARLLAATRAGLAERLAPRSLAAHQRVGAGLDSTGILGLLADALGE